MNQLYQDANNCSPFDVKFGGGVIKVSTDDTVIPAGWEVIISQQYQQVSVIIMCYCHYSSEQIQYLEHSSCNVLVLEISRGCVTFRQHSIVVVQFTK